ncbi:MAG: membrane protein insertase YidC [Candidatus Peribacteraceae bacterium]|nr:membrane protein insertase YidC [Candidatus Peribacteraceae bacterium]MBP9850811.1 membrane protein insertase YidC [Candidatus Peribacteraceae bacterium]
MAAQKSKLSTLEFLVTFVALFFVTNYALGYFFPKNENTNPTVVMSMEDASVAEGNDPIIVIKNETEKDLTLPTRCPQPPVNIAFIEGEGSSAVKSDLMANSSVLPCTDVLLIGAGKSVDVNMASWKYALFERNGKYEATLDLPENFAAGNPDNRAVTSFTISPVGFFTKLFRTFITKPLYNGLVFIASWVPGHNLGVAIILLTILVKLVLLVPNQHALEGQKKLQQMQPRMDEIKKKFPNDPTRVQEETMKLWKEMKINPLQSCLPTLLQLPILIGLFFVVKSGVSIETSQHMLYTFYHELPPQYFGHFFLGFDLLKPSIWIMPPLLVVLQFIQMKMMMAKQKKKSTDIIVKPQGKKSWVPELDQQTVMTYIMPLMIGFFAFQFPVAVSLYWAVSTLFGIAQQFFVMKEKKPLLG